MKFKNLTGMKFNRLTVLSYAGRKKWSYYLCRCDCGKEKLVRIDHLQNGKTSSCGCYKLENARKPLKHGLSSNKLYFVWASMMDRCYNDKFSDYHNYGGRGIKVDDRWHDVSNFVNDMQQGYNNGLQLDRINNNMNYSKDNCRWVTRKENNRNKRTNVYVTINNERKTVSEWCEHFNIRKSSIYPRIRKGLTGMDALFGVNNKTNAKKVHISDHTTNQR